MGVNGAGGSLQNHIVDETLNILKYRVSDKADYSFIRNFIDGDIIKIVYADEVIEEKALEIFKENISRKKRIHLYRCIISCCYQRT